MNIQFKALPDELHQLFAAVQERATLAGVESIKIEGIQYPTWGVYASVIWPRMGPGDEGRAVFVNMTAEGLAAELLVRVEALTP